jgi:hypothetical protein
VAGFFLSSTKRIPLIVLVKYIHGLFCCNRHRPVHFVLSGAYPQGKQDGQVVEF